MAKKDNGSKETLKTDLKNNAEKQFSQDSLQLRIANVYRSHYGERYYHSDPDLYVKYTDKDLEDVVLGSIIIDMNAMQTASTVLTMDDFSDIHNRLLYSAIEQVYANNKIVDLMLVTEYLRGKNITDDCGGILRIVNLTNLISSTENLSKYCNILKRLSVTRKYLNSVAEVSTMLTKGDDILDVWDELRNRMDNAINSCVVVSNVEPEKRIEETINDIKDVLDKKKVSGLSSGLPDLDQYTAGFRKGDLIILAARPAMGKSAIALTFAHNVSKDGNNVGILSLEMDAKQIAIRELSMRSGVKYSDMNRGNIDGVKFMQIMGASDEVKQSKVYIDDAPHLDIKILKSKLHTMVGRYKIQLLIIDYLNIMDLGDGAGYNIVNAIEKTVRDIKKLAKEYNIPIILLSQLSREVEKTGNSWKDKIPQLHHLRSSGGIEQVADIVMMLCRPEYYEDFPVDDDNKDMRNTIIVNIAKNKQGETGLVSLNCDIAHNMVWGVSSNKSEKITEPSSSNYVDLPF